MAEKFQFLGKIGEGAFASVFKVKRKEDGEIYAFKKIKSNNMKDRDLANCLNQIRILASLKNPYVIGYKEAFYDNGLKSFCLVTQFAENGDLATKIGKLKKKKQYLKQQQIWKAAIQLLFGIKALHKLNVFHRDIKPANILLGKNDDTYKLADMNVSVISKTGLANTQTGTPYYASPQVWAQRPYNGKSDIWSLGCVLYQMAAQRPPFLAADLPTLRRRIIQNDSQRIPDYFSDELDKFIRSCMIKDQNLRMKATQLLQLPIIKQKIKNLPNQTFNEPYFPILQKQSNMISTIRIDNRNFKSLDGKLPRKYENLTNKENLKNHQNYKIENNCSCLPNIQNNIRSPLLKNNSILKQKLPSIKRSESDYRSKKKIQDGQGKRQYLKKLRC